MSLLTLIKTHIKNGAFREARRLIDNEDDVMSLMGGNEASNYSQSSTNNDDIPLLVMLSLIKDEDTAVILSRILLEKGYHQNKSDKNGLCALNYAIALNRVKLLNLFLSSFNFDLNTYRDCYKNSFLHYVFAVNNIFVVNRFAEIYSKYYEWDVNKFKFIKNKDGLSVKDVYDFKLAKQLIKVRAVNAGNKNYRIMSSYRPFRAGERIRTNDSINPIQLICMPKSFYLESNPVHIVKFINQVFNNNELTTLNADLKFVESNIKNLNLNSQSNLQSNSSTTREFKMNILHQIKNVNKVKPIIFSSRLSNQNESKYRMNLPFYSDNLPSKYLYGKSEPNSILPVSTRTDSSWKNDLSRLFLDYSVSTTPSFRLGSVPPIKYIHSDYNFESSMESIDENIGSNKNNILLPNNINYGLLNQATTNDISNHATLHNLNQIVEIKQKHSATKSSKSSLPRLGN